MSKGYVYVLSNPSMPGLVKIGRTERDPNQRAVELWQTGVPTPFVVEGAFLVPDCAEAERRIHESCKAFRVHGSREFFRCEVKDALAWAESWRDYFVDDLIHAYRPGYCAARASTAIKEIDFDAIASAVDCDPRVLAAILACADLAGYNRILLPAFREAIAHARKMAEEFAEEEDAKIVPIRSRGETG